MIYLITGLLIAMVGLFVAFYIVAKGTPKHS